MHFKAGYFEQIFMSQWHAVQGGKCFTASLLGV
jgi:hypothetical protein